MPGKHRGPGILKAEPLKEDPADVFIAASPYLDNPPTPPVEHEQSAYTREALENYRRRYGPHGLELPASHDYPTQAGAVAVHSQLPHQRTR